jgi:hypothetical protein
MVEGSWGNVMGECGGGASRSYTICSKEDNEGKKKEKNEQNNRLSKAEID